MSTGPAAPERTWPRVLNTLLEGQDLDTPTTAWAMDQIMSGEATPVQVAGFLVALRAKGETVAEMTGLADEMLAHARRFSVDGDALDIVGTGSDGADTVNISTMSAIVAAAAGVPVVKHGNRAASSKTGTADVLEALGVRLDLSPEHVRATALEAGITFCFAQTFHPSMRHAAAARSGLKVRTAFNLLGPLTNPAQPTYAAIGCADLRRAPLIAGVFAGRAGRAAVFRGRDGLDEVTSMDSTDVWWVRDGRVTEWVLDPRRLGIPLAPAGSLAGGYAQENAQVVRDLVAGAPGPVRDAVLLNTGVALALADDAAQGDEDTLHDAVGRAILRAAEAIDSGAAARLLERWIATTQRLHA